MFGNITLIGFILSLAACIVFDISVEYALIFGAFIFYIYGVYEMREIKKPLLSMLAGLHTIKNILKIFALIGLLTATWRFSGTIAYIIYKIVPMVDSRYFLLYTFLLCSMMSMLTGTSLGACASMGVVCMVISRYIGVNPVYMGGAIISGIYVGDRNSPMSSSATLVAELTDTDIYINIKNMLKTAAPAYIFSCILYVLLGLRVDMAKDIDLGLLDVFSDNFVMHPILVLPAIFIVVLSLAKIDVKIVMAVSILSATIISYVIQGTQIVEMVKMCIFGFKSMDPNLAIYMDGGGLISMVRAMIIVGISSTYFGIFKESPILAGVKNTIEDISLSCGVYTATLISGILTSAIACNQTLASMLTYQLTLDIHQDKYIHALNIENTAIIVPAVIPWNIAYAIPMTMVGFGIESVWFSFFCYLVPLSELIRAVVCRQNSSV